MGTYGQFCPVAIASEVLTERWTPLIVRELIAGSKRFSELKRGVPLMSPSLLSKRLKTLERAGVITRDDSGRSGSVAYSLTPAGEELRPIVDSIGAWGMRWVRGRDLKPEHLDASLLMWDMRRSVIAENLPTTRAVTHFHIRGSTDGKSHFWFVIDQPEVDLCLIDPGHEIDLEVQADIVTMVKIWMGDVTFADAISAGDLRLTGTRDLVRGFTTWFSLSGFAGIEPG